VRSPLYSDNTMIKGRPMTALVSGSQPRDAAHAAPVAILTGASRRIGSAIARDLHALGWRLLLHYRSGPEAAALEAELNATRSGSAFTLQGDLADAGLPERIASEAMARFGRIDALINNASSFYPTALDTLTAPQFDDLLTSNLRGPLFLAQACARHMGPGSSIVNLLDIHARKPMPGYVAYCAAKAALWSVTESLAVELAPRIRVNGVAPGRMIWGAGDNLDDAQKAAEQARIPMARLGGGDEVSRAVCFLVSEAAAYVNGAILPVDGGLRLA